ncbi:RNA polymerase sigma factor [Streptomyces macrosporus]|uniref:Sigma-70 family RNA polymerase sigma factor n=1 Tax=Streptomyces macrosporus TaxID=44032 RepID=A0ABN3JH51_9ACTN
MRARVRAGDPAAFGELFDEYATVVHRYAVRVTGDWSAAEDVVSLTFLEGWRLRETVRPDGESLRPWLLGIATNVMRNTARAARRHRAALARLPAKEVVPDFADELVGRMADSERLAAARRALARLRRTEREVFVLCVWSGLDYAAAAEALGVKVGTVRSRLSRARARLRGLTDAELERPREATPRQATGEPEPPAGRGQVQGGRTEAARSTRERTR